MNEIIKSLEGILLDTKESPLQFAHPDQDRLIAARALEGKGLRALAVVGSYWTITGTFIEESCPEIPRVLQDVWDREFKKYDHLLAEDLIFEIAKEVLGYAPREDEVISVERYESVYSCVHSIIQPQMIMGRMDTSFRRDRTPERTMRGLLEGYRTMRQIMS